MKRETRHIPVLLDQVLQILDPEDGKYIVDCTLGLGGHAAAMLSRLSDNGRLIGIDFDPANIALAREKLSPISSGFELHHNNFAAIQTILIQSGLNRADGILADLGVASPQIDDPGRGFSYRHHGPLDMRMDPTRGRSAADIINRIPRHELESALLEFGDETDAPQIAELIVRRRKLHPIATTDELTALICEARDFTLKRAAGAKLHPAARSFQALRILVNREIANLERLLAVLPQCLKPGGTAAIISFHSGEDRRVKASFREGLRAGIYSDISPDPIIAGEAEQKLNPRSRSAKLRWAKLG
jgi:16S rRNA (cytosine1402-N4)-methyltransferase